MQPNAISNLDSLSIFDINGKQRNKKIGNVNTIEDATLTCLHMTYVTKLREPIKQNRVNTT